MSKTAKKLLAVAIAGLAITLAASQSAHAQYPVAVAPAVVGYSAEPAGLFGFQTRYRPVVAPVAVAPVTYVQPVYRSTVYHSTVYHSTAERDPAPAVPYATPVATPYYQPAPVVATTVNHWPL